ncbi:hypothetical protein EWB00_003276, partial [Schistosoma japonicum]
RSNINALEAGEQALAMTTTSCSLLVRGVELTMCIVILDPARLSLTAGNTCYNTHEMCVVSKTNTNLPSFSGFSRNTLPRCGQPGSDNRPHTRKRTRVQIDQNHILSTPYNISLISTTNSTHIPSSHYTTNTNDASSRKVIPGLLKPRPRLHVGALNVRTLSQIGQQAFLAMTLESHSID